MKILKKFSRNLIGYIIGVVILLIIFIFLIICVQIGNEVKNQCKIAQNHYRGECVDALMNQISDESIQSRKNDAIWALGQLGDKQALPFLKKYDDKQPLPDREPWNEGISQYELRKAINLLESGFNISSLFWKE